MSKSLKISNSSGSIRRPMREGEEYPYDIIPRNTETRAEKVPVARVKGITEGIDASRHHDSLLSQAAKDEGWAHYATRGTGPFFNRIPTKRGNDKPEGRGK